MNIRYLLHLNVPAKLVGTIIELLDGEGIMIQCEPITHTRMRAPGGPPKKAHYAGGWKNKGVSSKEFLIKLVSAGPKTLEQLQEAFTSHVPPFAKSTVGATISQLVRSNKVQWTSDRKLVPTRVVK